MGDARACWGGVCVCGGGGGGGGEDLIPIEKCFMFPITEYYICFAQNLAFFPLFL